MFSNVTREENKGKNRNKYNNSSIYYWIVMYDYSQKVNVVFLVRHKRQLTKVQYSSKEDTLTWFSLTKQWFISAFIRRNYAKGSYILYKLILLVPKMWWISRPCSWTNAGKISLSCIRLCKYTCLYKKQPCKNLVYFGQTKAITKCDEFPTLR